MWEGDGPINFHAVAHPEAPHRAGKVAEPVGGKKRGAFEGGNEKSTRKMCLVVLDAMELRVNLLGVGIEGGCKRLGNTRKFRKNFDACLRERRHAQRIKKFCAQPCVRVSRYRDVIDVRECEARFLQAITDRLRGKSCRVLHAVEAFFLDRSD